MKLFQGFVVVRILIFSKKQLKRSYSFNFHMAKLNMPFKILRIVKISVVTVCSYTGKKSKIHDKIENRIFYGFKSPVSPFMKSPKIFLSYFVDLSRVHLIIQNSSSKNTTNMSKNDLLEDHSRDSHIEKLFCNH